MIIEFCNKKFYNNELIILSDIKSDRKPLMVYKTIAGNLAINNLNQRQIDVIKEGHKEMIEVYEKTVEKALQYLES